MDRPPIRIARSLLIRAPWLLPSCLIYAVCRIPSFFEPHWYTDEAGYTVTARALLRGSSLYAGAWTNKPPLQVWAVALPLRLFGPAEPGLHALTFLSGLIALVGVGVLAAHLLTRPRATIATALFALAIGLPLFQAQLALPESLLIAPGTWAAVIVFTRLLGDRSPGRRPTWLYAAGAGALIGLALGFQQTVLADAAVFAVALWLAPRLGRAVLAAYLLAILAVVTAWLAPALLAAGPSALSFALVGFYSSYVAYSLPVSPFGIALRALGPLLALVALFTIRRSGGRHVVLALWACADLAVSAIANRPYPHFLVPALAPAILLLASLPLARPHFRWRLAPLAASLVLTAPFGLTAGVDTVALTAYARLPAAQLTGNRIDWDAQLDARSPADREVARWIRDQGLAGASAVVWSSDAWPYLLADLPVSLPAAPIYNDVVILGSSQTVASAVQVMEPQLIVTSEEAIKQWPEIGPLLESAYDLALESYPDKVYIRRGPGG